MSLLALSALGFNALAEVRDPLSAAHSTRLAAQMLTAGWLGLLVAQTALIQFGRRFDHQRLGRLAAATGLAAPVAWAAAAALRAVSLSRAGGAADGLADVLLVLDLVQALGFAATLAGALHRRDKPDFHRRGMLLALVWLLPLALTPQVASLSDLVRACAAADAVVLLALVRDLLRLRRIHRVHRVGVPLVLVAQGLGIVFYVERWPVILGMVDSALAGRF